MRTGNNSVDTDVHFWRVSEYLYMCVGEFESSPSKGGLPLKVL